MEEPEIVEERPGRCTARWRNIALMFGGAPSSTEEFDRLEHLLTEMLEAREGGVAVLRWVPEGSRWPEDSVRERVSRLFDGLGPSLLGYVAVMEGSGFWASGARAVLTDIEMRSRFSIPLGVVSEISEGAQWLATRLGPSSDASEITRLATGLRARVLDSDTRA